jgi:hypothetical protein
MDLLKTPQQMLLEEAGIAPATPGMVNTPKQMLMQEAGIQPHMAVNGQNRLANGGQPQQMSPQDMLAALVASGHLPAHYATGGGVLGTNYKPEYNPEATMQATPFLSSSAPVTNAAKSKFADIFGQAAADRIFGGPQGEDAIYQAAQMANPVTGALGVADMPFSLYTDLKKDDYLGAGITTAGGALSAIPAYKPAKALVKAGHEKIKKLLKP